MVNIVVVELKPEEAQLFREFQEHRKAFKTMLEAGVFHMKQGISTLSFSPEGTLTRIENTHIAFRSGS